MTRKLATLQTIKTVEPAENSDALDLITFKEVGWQCISERGLHHPEKRVVYVEADAFVPTPVAPWLTKPGKTPSTYNGVDGERLKTVKLRGNLSQGIILNPDDMKSAYIEQFNEASYSPEIKSIYNNQCLPLLAANNHHSVEDGFDFTGFLGIQLWERPEPSGAQGNRRGNFPSYIRKTDQERIQNLYNKVRRRAEEDPLEFFEVTEKLDGSSMTVYVNKDGYVGVCSRNNDLLDEPGVTFWEVAHRYKLPEKLGEMAYSSLAIQGELVGPSVQGNKLGLKERDFYVFDIWNIDTQEYLDSTTRQQVVESLGLKHVPIIRESLTMNFFCDLKDVLAFSDGKSALNDKVLREGLVYKSKKYPNFSFKAISNQWLLKFD